MEIQFKGGWTEIGGEVDPEAKLRLKYPQSERAEIPDLELLPCPFCGESPGLEFCPWGPYCVISCVNDDCGVIPDVDLKSLRDGQELTWKKAAEIWNRRA